MIEIYNLSNIDILKAQLNNRELHKLSHIRYLFTKLSDDKYLIKFSWINGQSTIIIASMDKLLIITDSNDIRHYASRIEPSLNGLIQLNDFFMEITSDDIDKLEKFEDEISSLEDKLLTAQKPSQDGVSQIVSLRKDLLSIKQYYVQMEFLTDEIAAANSEFTYIDKRFDKLLEFVLHLQEYIEQVREAYQSQIDIEQNALMKVFTVITTIFLPLTLIVGWYGMNLKMPEFEWTFGYPLVIAVSLILVVTLIIIFKKKKWF